MTLNKTKIASAVVLASTLVSAPTFAQELSEVEVSVGGFTRVDYSNGDRYSESQGEDQFGISRAAVVVSAKHENIEGVFVAGTEILTNDDPNTDGNIDIKDAFLVLKEVGGSPVTFSVGAQPLLFGLKPNGYPSDHSLQASIEYGATGAFGVAGQAGPSIIAYADSGDFNFRGGVFDITPYVGEDPEDDGAAITDSFFLQVKGDNIGDTGIYGVLGYESLFVTPENDGEQIYTIGLGWKNAQFDISAEYIELEAAAALRDAILIPALESGLFLDGEIDLDDENYIVVEASFKPSEDVSIYLDYAEATELFESSTIRFGVDYWTSKNLKLSAEYAQDEIDSELLGLDDDFSSIDFRITLEY